MKKFFKLAILPVLTAIIALTFAACNNNLKEVSGTYNMTYVSGTVNGVSISTSSYEYYRIILENNGNGKVESKAVGSPSTYEATGTWNYDKENGKINFISKSGSASVTETFDYADGVLTYAVDVPSMKLTIILNRVQEGE
ncbi:MAG: hypothetical protein ACI4MC_01595 [Candidatus Coproplasma sp.]